MSETDEFTNDERIIEWIPYTKENQREDLERVSIFRNVAKYKQ